MVNSRIQLQINEEFNSHNTKRLNLDQMKEKLLEIEIIKKELKI